MTEAQPRSLYSLSLLYSEETYSTHSNLYIVLELDASCMHAVHKLPEVAYRV